jgi:hypothetical protein
MAAETIFSALYHDGDMEPEELPRKQLNWAIPFLRLGPRMARGKSEMRLSREKNRSGLAVRRQPPAIFPVRGELILGNELHHLGG